MSISISLSGRRAGAAAPALQCDRGLFAEQPRIAGVGDDVAGRLAQRTVAVVVGLMSSDDPLEIGGGRRAAVNHVGAEPHGILQFANGPTP
ncbi:MAG TPA: hypothetical protein VGF84_22290 [Micromonosporaceae bacterium]